MAMCRYVSAIIHVIMCIHLSIHICIYICIYIYVHVYIHMIDQTKAPKASTKVPVLFQGSPRRTQLRWVQIGALALSDCRLQLLGSMRRLKTGGPLWEMYVCRKISWNFIHIMWCIQKYTYILLNFPTGTKLHIMYIYIYVYVYIYSVCVCLCVCK